MTVEVANGVAEVLSYPNGGVQYQTPSNATALKKSRESERRRRRRKQKKNSKASQQPAAGAYDSDTAADEDRANYDSAKENADHQKTMVQVQVEYVPEKAELEGDLDEEFRKVFEKFRFTEIEGSEENDKKDETAANAVNKKVDLDSEEEEKDTQQKEKGLSN